MGLYATTTDVDIVDIGDAFDTVVTDGLLGTPDSLSYRVGEIERHVHSYERWFGASAGNVGPGLETVMTAFRATSSATANAFGTAIVVFDGTEVVQVGMVKWDPHRVHILNAQTTDVYRFRMVYARNGEATAAAAVTNGNYTDMIIKIDSTNTDFTSIPMQARRMPIATKSWAQLAKATAGAAWMEFMVGLHYYEG